jgi:septal ring factor EnvC (AmiA/AmiB activator)
MLWFLWLQKYKNIIAVMVIGAIVVCGFLVVTNAFKERDRLREEVKQLAEALKTEQESHEKMVTALEGSIKDAKQRSDFEKESRKEIEKDRKGGDGPMAPVLRNAIERLRTRQATNSPDS